MEGACGRLSAFGLSLGVLVVCGLVQASDCAAPLTATPIQVRFAIDGDTVRLADGRSLRLIGINTLETGKRGAADEPLAADAERRLGELLRLGPTRLVMGREAHDHYGRTLGDLFAADDTLIAATLAAEGLGLAIAVPPNVERIDCVLAAEHDARRMRRGLWAAPAAWTMSAGAAPLDLRGFKRITGRVTGRETRSAGTAVVLDDRLELWFPTSGAVATAAVLGHATTGATLTVRGWWRGYRGRPSLRIDHPAQVEDSD